MTKKKVIRVSTVPISLDLLLKGQLRFLNNYFDILAVSSPGDSLNIVEQREGVKTKSIKIERKIAPIRDLISLFELYWLFKKEKPDIVHSITPKAGLLSMLAAYFAGCPVRVHTFTGLVFPSKKGLLQKVLIFMDKILCSCATNIFPEGEGVKNDLINYGITNKDLKIIGNGNVNGVDVSYFSAEKVLETDKICANLGIAQNDFVFIFIGRLVKDKGINELVNAFDILSNESDNIKLLLVGNYEDSDPLTNRTLELIKTNKLIINVGFQKDIRPYLKVSKVLVFPSYREGFPNVVLQASAMGVPSIVTNISGSNEIISNLKNGVIIDPKSLPMLISEMRNMKNGFYDIKLMGEMARDNIVNKFDQDYVWNEVLKEYKSF